jgi:hypothetical protein
MIDQNESLTPKRSEETNEYEDRNPGPSNGNLQPGRLNPIVLVFLILRVALCAKSEKMIKSLR